MPHQYEREDLDFNKVWCNEESVLYIYLHGSDGYKAMTYSIVKGICHPVDKIEFRTAEWLLRLIHKDGFNPTPKNLRLVEESHETNGLFERA